MGFIWDLAPCQTARREQEPAEPSSRAAWAPLPQGRHHLALGPTGEGEGQRKRNLPHTLLVSSPLAP